MGAVSISPDPGTSLSQASRLTVFMEERSGVLKIQRCIFFLRRIRIKGAYYPQSTQNRVPVAPGLVLLLLHLGVTQYSTSTKMTEPTSDAMVSLSHVSAYTGSQTVQPARHFAGRDPLRYTHKVNSQCLLLEGQQNHSVPLPLVWPNMSSLTTGIEGGHWSAVHRA